MKKTAVFFVTACLLICLSPQLKAQPQKIHEIEVFVLGENGARKIDMGEKYSYAVPPEATIRWKCKYDFIVQFAGDAPFDKDQSAEPLPKDFKVIEKKARHGAATNQNFKYTIFVVDSDDHYKPLALDPIIIIIPPRPDN